MRNLLTRVPKSAQSFVATMVRTIFAQPDADTVHGQHARIVEQLQARFPEAAELLADAGPDLLAFHRLPQGALAAALEQQLARAHEQGGSAAAPTSSASSPTAPRSSASSAPSSPNRTTSGPSPAAT